MPSTAIFALRWVSLRSSAFRMSLMSPLKTGKVAPNVGCNPQISLPRYASQGYYPPLPSIRVTWKSRIPRYYAAKADGGRLRGDTWAPTDGHAPARLGRVFRWS